MISGISLLRRAAALAVALAPMLAHAGWDLPALMTELARQPSGQAAFIEMRALSILDEPVVSRGELVFRAPGHLEKLTREPRPERLVVDGDQLLVEDARGQRQFALSQHPEIRVFVEALLGVLTGDSQRLGTHYELTLAGTRTDWRLRLVPRDAGARRWVREVTVTGSGGAIAGIETLQADGDRSTLSIVAPAR